MSRKLRATSCDIPLLSDYLHDAGISIDDISFDEGSKKFKINLQRVGYENGQEGKTLWIIPVIRYPIVESVLSISNVEKMELIWLDDAFKDDAGYPHELLEIKLEENNLSLSSDMFIIHLSVSASPELILEDISQPSDKTHIVDFSTSVFSGVKEIDKLKI